MFHLDCHLRLISKIKCARFYEISNSGVKVSGVIMISRSKFFLFLLALVAIVLSGCGASGDSENLVTTSATEQAVPTSLSFQSVPQRTAGTNFNVIKVTVIDSEGNVVADAANPITIALTNPGAATISGTLTQTALNGVACFDDLSIDLIGNYSFTASSPGLIETQSQSFEVTPAVASTITFRQQPLDVAEGKAFEQDIVIEVRDAFGNLVLATDTTISISNDPSGTASLTGTTRATTVDGLATFSGLTIGGGAGPGFTLQVGAGDATDTSNAFEVALLITRTYTANFGRDSITVHGINDDGNVAPIRVIAGRNSQLANPIDVAVAGNDLVCLNQSGSRISFYPLDGDGDLAPTRVIGGANTRMNGPIQLLVFNDEIFVANQAGRPSITVYPLSGSGDIEPTREIMGGATTLTDVQGLAIQNNELFASNAGPDSISVFNVTDNGDVAPQRVISGALTGLNNPLGICVQENEIFVANEFSDVRVFNATDSGNVEPKRVIGGRTTGLTATRDVVVLLGELFVADGSSIRVFNIIDDGDV